LKSPSSVCFRGVPGPPGRPDANQAELRGQTEAEHERLCSVDPHVALDG